MFPAPHSPAPGSARYGRRPQHGKFKWSHEEPFPLDPKKVQPA
jgi:hypothetical protein